MSEEDWVGYDLDRTLAQYERGDFHKYGATHIGDPIPKMIAHAKNTLKLGKRIKILTARCLFHHTENNPIIKSIHEWSREHLGQQVEVTCIKDSRMIHLYDDRASRVIQNEGLLAENVLEDAIYMLAEDFCRHRDGKSDEKQVRALIESYKKKAREAS